MTNKDITKIYFRGNEIVALYRGSTLIFKKSGGGSTTKPTGVYTVRGTLKPDSRAQNIQLCVNGQREQFDVNNDKTFEYTFVNVPVTNMDYFTLACKDELKTIDLSSLDTSQVTSMIEAFFQCEVESLNISNLDTSSVTNMSGMFKECTNLTSLDVSNFDTSNVTSMASMFSYCPNLTSLDASNFDTSNVTSMTSMFSNCYNLTSLDVSNFDTSKVINMTSMFLGNWNLTSLDVSNFDTSKVINMSYMFYSDSELTDLYMNFDVRSIKDDIFNYDDIFFGCHKLTNVIGKFEGTEYNLDLHYSPLTAASAMVFINGLATVTEKRTLALSATTYDSLTNEQIAIATSKGWTVTRS